MLLCLPSKNIPLSCPKKLTDFRTISVRRQTAQDLVPLLHWTGDVTVLEQPKPPEFYSQFHANILWQAKPLCPSILATDDTMPKYICWNLWTERLTTDFWKENKRKRKKKVKNMLKTEFTWINFQTVKGILPACIEKTRNTSSVPCLSEEALFLDIHHKQEGSSAM